MHGVSALIFRHLKLIAGPKPHASAFVVTTFFQEKSRISFKKKGFALFAIDCIANPRIYANKVEDRTIVHAPNHVPGQKPITVGHEYSVLVHLPNQKEGQELHWVVPLSVIRTGKFSKLRNASRRRLALDRTFGL